MRFMFSVKKFCDTQNTPKIEFLHVQLLKSIFQILESRSEKICGGNQEKTVYLLELSHLGKILRISLESKK